MTASSSMEEPTATKSVTTSLVSGLSEKWAADLAKAMDRDYLSLLTGSSGPKPKPLTRWQKIKRSLTKRRYAGEWLTRKLMEHYNIYEGD